MDSEIRFAHNKQRLLILECRVYNDCFASDSTGIPVPRRCVRVHSSQQTGLGSRPPLWTLSGGQCFRSFLELAASASFPAAVTANCIFFPLSNSFCSIRSPKCQRIHKILTFNECFWADSPVESCRGVITSGSVVETYLKQAIRLIMIIDRWLY